MHQKLEEREALDNDKKNTQSTANITLQTHNVHTYIYYIVYERVYVYIHVNIT